MMPSSVGKNGEKSMINIWDSLTSTLKVKNGISAPIPSSPLLKLSSKGALNLFKFAKDSFNLLLKERTLKSLNSEVQDHLK